MSKTPRPRRRKREQVHDVIAQSPDHPTLKIDHIFDHLGAALDATNRTASIARRLPEGSLSTELLEQVSSTSLALSQLQDSLHLLRDARDPALLQTYQKIGDDLFAARTPSEVGNAALPTLCRLVGCDWAFVALAEPTPEYSTLLSLYENEEESQIYIPPLWESVETLSRELLSVASPKTPFVYSNNRPIESPRKPDIHPPRSGSRLRRFRANCSASPARRPLSFIEIIVQSNHPESLMRLPESCGRSRPLARNPSSE